MTHVHKEWTSELAVKTEDILQRAQKRKPKWIKTVDSALYWTLLFVAILGNFVISVVLVPFLLVLKGISLYFCLFVIGCSFGWIFSFILHNLEQLQPNQRIIAGFFIPAVALINMGIFAILSNKLIVLMNLPTPTHNPFLVGGIYVIGYIIPDIVSHIRKNKK